MQLSGIYKIQSISKKIYYIGSAKNIDERIKRHKYELTKNKHNNKKLQNHYNKYGESDLIYTVVEYCSVDKLIEREQYYLNTGNELFNILKNAYSMAGYTHSLDAINKIKQKNKGRKMTEEQIRKGVISRIGQRTSKGCKRTEAQKQKISEKRKKSVVYNNNIYPSLIELSSFLNIKYQTLYAMINNINKNKLNLKYL